MTGISSTALTRAIAVPAALVMAAGSYQFGSSTSDGTLAAIERGAESPERAVSNEMVGAAMVGVGMLRLSTLRSTTPHAVPIAVATAGLVGLGAGIVVPYMHARHADD